MRRIAVAVSLLTTTLVFAAPQPASSKELLDKGKSSFEINCAPCHGPKGVGDGPAAVALNPKPRNFTVDPFKQGEKPENVFETLGKGVKDTAMVSFAHLPEQERWALAYYVLELRSAGKPAAAAVPDAGAKAKPAPKPKK